MPSSLDSPAVAVKCGKGDLQLLGENLSAVARIPGQLIGRGYGESSEPGSSGWTRTQGSGV